MKKLTKKIVSMLVAAGFAVTISSVAYAACTCGGSNDCDEHVSRPIEGPGGF